MDSNATQIVIGLASGIVGGVLGVLGSKWVARDAVKRQEKEAERVHVQSQWEAYNSLWRFLKESNMKATSHSSLSKIKGCTHVFSHPKDYAWLRDHFQTTKCLLSSTTYELYINSLKKDKFGMAVIGTNTHKLIPANYIKLQNEAKQRCSELEKQYGDLIKHNTHD